MDRTFSLIKNNKSVKTFRGKSPYALAKKIANAGIKNIVLKEKRTKNIYKYKVINGKLQSETKKPNIKCPIKSKKMKGGALRPQRKQQSRLGRTRSFTPRQLEKRIYHCYIVPFTFVNRRLEILIAKKTCFNKRDGWIQNNPGQYVFFGGHCRNTSARDVYESSFKEFEEESGNQLQDRRSTILKRWDDYSTLFYEVESKEEYRKFGKLRSKSQYKEMASVKWISSSEAFKIMDPGKVRYNNPVCYGNVRKFVSEYMYSMKKNNPKMREHYIIKIKRHIYQNTGERINEERYNEIMKDIRQKQKRSKYYEIVADFFFMFIRKKIKTDWFYDALVYLDRDILS